MPLSFELERKSANPFTNLLFSFNTINLFMRVVLANNIGDKIFPTE